MISCLLNHSRIDHPVKSGLDRGGREVSDAYRKTGLAEFLV